MALHQPFTLLRHRLFSQYTSVNRIHLVPFFFCITIFDFIIIIYYILLYCFIKTISSMEYSFYFSFIK
nr:MAG TPA: hypothetical protein [Caudoviricetes sp.]DAK36914.1 MAG TPA: hypothetical protein [Caudoviricetes sp.]DAT02280.1 MAG TPA: hypothetical protein [Caudoviricetes sp.]DAU33880.1 MAG TPA: hypothetical protein [Caudoviricetes sp.]